MSVAWDARRWAAADADAAEAAARALADAVAGVAFDGLEDGPVVDGRVWRRAYFTLGDRRYALVPGGTARLGFDVAAFTPTPAQAASHANGAADYGFTADVHEFLRGMGEFTPGSLSPPREVYVPSLLVAVEAVEVDELVDLGDSDDLDEDAETDETEGFARQVSAALAVFGARAITPDEWEYACGAGAGTLFRWGDGYPESDDPLGAPDGPQHEPNRFGLVIARDPYESELTSDPDVLVGGDGGEATCGGYGSFLAWLPLASAYRLTPQDDLRDEYLDGAKVRPVIDVLPAKILRSYERLRDDPDAWADDEAELSEWDGLTGDGPTDET